MPETTMDEDHLLPGAEDHVGFPRKVSGSQPIAISEPMSETANDHFSLGVLASDQGHAFAAFAFSEGVHVGQ
jgi:hypothetical protein